MRDAIIIDLDGCLFVHKHLDKYLPKQDTQEAWEQYHKDVNYFADMPVDPVIYNLARFYMASGLPVIFLTAREETKENLTNTSNAIFNLFDEDKYGFIIIMRPLGNTEASFMFKQRQYEEHIKKYYNVKLVIDDNKDNIQMFNSLGLNTMLYNGSETNVLHQSKNVVCFV